MSKLRFSILWFTAQYNYGCNTTTDVEIRLTKTWSAHNKMSSIWKSHLDQPSKMHFFGKYSSLLLFSTSENPQVNSEQDHMTNKELHGNLLKLMEDRINWKRFAMLSQVNSD